MAESIKKLSAVCVGCGEKASFTKRTSKDQQITLIGDVDLYTSVCRKCYYVPMKETCTISTDISPGRSDDSGDR